MGEPGKALRNTLLSLLRRLLPHYLTHRTRCPAFNFDITPFGIGHPEARFIETSEEQEPAKRTTIALYFATTKIIWDITLNIW